MEPTGFSWALPAVLTAILGALGWFGKTVYDWREERKEAHAERRARLQQLRALLETSRRVFLIQIDQRDRLLGLLRDNHSGQVDESHGFDAAFSGLYGQFTAEEKELHGVIRAMTMNAMRELNLEMTEWLDTDSSFKTRAVRLRCRSSLAEELLNLELHLALWHAKYQYWIPGNEKHALVYLDDEKKHGIGFPRKVGELVEEALQELQESA